MQKMKGKNQTLARQINQRLVVQSLLKGNKSCTDLAKEFNLSNTAIAKILKEIVDLSLIDVVSSPKAESSLELGRRPILYAIVPRKYMSAVVNLAESQIILCDFCGEIIASHSFGERANVFTGKMLDIALESLQELLQKYPDISLRAISVVTFGMIDTVTGEYVFASRFENSKGLNLVNLFKAKFSDVKINVINDTKLYLLAEQNYGLLQRANNALLLQIDVGISSAFLFKGEMYGGDNGFSGEVGLTLYGKETLEELVSISAIKRQVEGDLSWKEIAKNYQSGDKRTKEVIENCGEIIGEAVKNLVHLFDCQIIICGRIVELGNEFLSVITRKLKGSAYLNAKVQFSEMDLKTAWQSGGMKYSIDLGLDSILRK